LRDFFEKGVWKIFVELAVDVNKEARFVWERANLSVGKDSRLELKRSLNA
jgi:hypothetical protein